MTRPGRALRWVDPVVPSPEPAARAAEILATLPPPEHLEKRKRSLQLTIEEVEVEEMLGPIGSFDDGAHALFAPRNDWVEIPLLWQVSTYGSRLPKILEQHI